MRIVNSLVNRRTKLTATHDDVRVELIDDILTKLRAMLGEATGIRRGDTADVD